MFEVTLPAERLVGLNEIAEPVEDELPPELEEPLPLEEEPEPEDESEELPDDELPAVFSIAKTRMALDFE